MAPCHTPIDRCGSLLPGPTGKHRLRPSEIGTPSLLPTMNGRSWTARVVVSDPDVWSFLPQLADHNEALIGSMADLLGRVEFSEGDDANEWDQHAGLMLDMVDGGLVLLEKLTRRATVGERPTERRPWASSRVRNERGRYDRRSLTRFSGHPVQ